MDFYNFKKGILFILLVFPFLTNRAQGIRGFGDVSLYYASEDFKKGLITNLGGGLEFEFHPLFKPEVAINYSIMGIKDIKDYNYDNTEIIKKDVSSINFTIGPKIYFWYHENDGNSVSYWYYITPKINMSRISATQNYSFIDHTNAANSFNEKYRIGDWQHSFGVSIGMEFPFFEESADAIAISVNITNINMGKTLNRLPYNEIDYSTIGFGVGISYYFGIKKANNRK